MISMKFIFLAVCAVVTFSQTSANIFFEPQKDVKLAFYWGMYNKQNYRLENFASLINDIHFNSSRPTMIYAHGFNEDQNILSVQTIINAYMQRDDHNVIILDWGAYSKGLYFNTVVPKLQKVGIVAAKYLVAFLDTGYPLQMVHLVGHSLGGQLVGLIGRQLREQSRGRYELPRITALDPAEPDFYPPFFTSFAAISAGDGKFVDVIHTDGTRLGARKPTGTVDFFPNSGMSAQPGCQIFHGNSGIIADACSHWRSWMFYSESVINPKAFLAVRANSWDDFVQGRTHSEDTAYMGFAATTNLMGNYYLQTNRESVFGRGKKGINFDPSIV